MPHPSQSNRAAGYDNWLIMRLVGLVQIVATIWFIVQTTRARTKLKNLPAGTGPWRDRSLDTLLAGLIIAYVSASTWILMAIYFNRFGKRTTVAVARHQRCKVAAVQVSHAQRSAGGNCYQQVYAQMAPQSGYEDPIHGHETVDVRDPYSVSFSVAAITLFAVSYFADFLLLGLWVGARWAVLAAVGGIKEDPTVKNVRNALVSLIVWLAFKTFAAVLGHAWAVIMRKCNENEITELRKHVGT